MKAIELIGVNKTFAEVTALNNLNLEIEAGQLTALLGPNGAGKTTAISLMLGLAAPSKGSVKILGHSPQNSTIRALIGNMPQESALPAALSVRETVTLFASLYPKPLKLETALQLADLNTVADRKAGQLSGGQKRRLAFALAVVGNPQILFLDEPTTGMDAGSRLAFWQAITELKQQGRTIVLTTHYLEEAERMANRVVVMNAGRVLADGSPDELRGSIAMQRMNLNTSLSLPELKALPHVEFVALDPSGRAEIRTAQPEQLLSYLVLNKVAFTDLEVRRASLEDVFLNLTHSSAVTTNAVTTNAQGETQ